MILGIRWRSLRAKIIAWSFFPAMLILSILAAAAVYGNEQTTRELTITSSREFTRLAAAQFESQLRDFLGVLEAATRLPDIQSGAAILQQTALGKVSDQLAVFDGGVVILNIYGKVAAVAPISEQPAAKGQPAAKEQPAAE